MSDARHLAAILDRAFPLDPVFAFAEDDHLIRIHLKFALQDLGFVVIERDGMLMLPDGTDVDGALREDVRDL